MKKFDKMPARSGEFSLPRLLIREGPEDVAFFRRLIEVRDLPRFHIRDTAGTKGGSGGNTKFGDALQASSGNRGFKLIRDIVLVTDSDDDADQAFHDVCRQISQAGIGTPPDNPNQPSNSHPSISIITLPLSGAPGSLESICIEAARRADKVLSAHIDHLATAVERATWSRVRRDKFWLRCNLAGRAPDPFIPLGRSFGDGTGVGLIPVNDPSFDDIAARLARLGHDPTPASKDEVPPPAIPRKVTRRDRPRPRPTRP